MTVRRCKVRFEYAFAQYGTPALAWAARRGRKDTVELLLDRGADLEAKDRVGASNSAMLHDGPRPASLAVRRPRWRRGVREPCSCRMPAWETLLEGLSGRR